MGNQCSLTSYDQGTARWLDTVELHLNSLWPVSSGTNLMDYIVGPLSGVKQYLYHSKDTDSLQSIGLWSKYQLIAYIKTIRTPS